MRVALTAGRLIETIRFELQYVLKMYLSPSLSVRLSGCLSVFLLFCLSVPPSVLILASRSIAMSAHVRSCAECIVASRCVKRCASDVARMHCDAKLGQPARPELSIPRLLVCAIKRDVLF